jgi:ABC-type multidrug transport system fused ATPase/permease subunit
MRFIDILQGTGIVLIIVIIAGVIAYLGDRVGHQVGRKRLTLFNIRPRYTSTIIAVATGMLIALVVTLVAIFASNQVKTAFFQLNEINSQIQKAQARAQELEKKVTTSPVVVNLGQPMSPTIGQVPLNAPAGLRHDVVESFYKQTVEFVDRQWTRPPYNLKKYVPPANLQQLLDSLANNVQMQAWVTQTPVLLFAVADQNFYPGDTIDFAVRAYPDRLIAPAGQMIAQLQIPAGKNVSAGLALYELNGYVATHMAGAGMPPYFAGDVRPQKTLPDMKEMQRMLQSSGGTYLMTAFAATDIFPHTFDVPVVVTLQKVPG